MTKEESIIVASRYQYLIGTVINAPTNPTINQIAPLQTSPGNYEVYYWAENPHPSIGDSFHGSLAKYCKENGINYPSLIILE